MTDGQGGPQQEPGRQHAPHLLDDDEPPAVVIHRPHATSPLLLIADHAGNSVPRRLQGLGVGAAELDRHIGWDIGIAGVTRRLADALDTGAVMQPYSRLVIDCNRRPGHPTSIPQVSDGTRLTANEKLGADAVEARIREIFRPYHDAVEAELARRGPAAVLIAMHSFTPALALAGSPRPWHIGLLYRHDRLARSLLTLLRAEGDLIVGDNEPYRVGDDTDYSIPNHGEARGILHVGIEIRQDLIAHEDGQREWAERLFTLLPQAVAAARGSTPER